MLLFKDMSEERQKEIIEFIIKNDKENFKDIAKRFNISSNKVRTLQRKYLKNVNSFTI